MRSRVAAFSNRLGRADRPHAGRNGFRKGKSPIDFIIDFFATVPDLAAWEAVGFYVLSFFTSAMTAAAGIGGGIVLLAALTTVYPPFVLIPVHAVVQLGSNGGRALIMLRHVMWRYLTAFLAGAAVGGVVGAQIFAELPTSLLRIILGLFILYMVWGPQPKALAPSHRTFAGVGFATSFAGIFVGGTGPMIAPFIAAATPERRTVVATHAMLMTFVHIIRIAAFGVLGFAFAPYAGFVIGMIVTGFLGTVAGRYLLDRIPERAFRVAFKTILTILALRLLYAAVT